MSNVHINRPSSTRYVARVCGGLPQIHRAWPAVHDVRGRLQADGRHWKRGDVIVVADYYDPELVAEAVRR